MLETICVLFITHASSVFYDCQDYFYDCQIVQQHDEEYCLETMPEDLAEQVEFYFYEPQTKY